jgi:uncharacterized protein
MMKQAEIRRFEESLAGGLSVRGWLHVPSDPSGDGLVVTHGAGSNCDAPLLVALATAFCESGVSVLRCDLPFRQVRPQGPPTWPAAAEHDRHGLQLAVGAMKKVVSGRVFLGGHSYGGRQASMLAASEPDLVPALLLLSYPLHPPKRPAQLRSAHFPSLRTPALFVHGTRDGFGTIEDLTVAIKLIPARTEVVPVESAGHELMNARNRDKLPKMIIGAFKECVKHA